MRRVFNKILGEKTYRTDRNVLFDLGLGLFLQRKRFPSKLFGLFFRSTKVNVVKHDVSLHGPNFKAKGALFRV